MSNSIDYSKLFLFEDPLANRPLRLGPEQDWVTTDTVLTLFHGECHPPEPVVLKTQMGGQATDILWSTFPPIMCISEKLRDILIENNFTGWSTYPVKVYGRHGEYLPGYHGLAVKGFAGKYDLGRSQKVINPPHIPGGKPVEVYRGFFFDENKWDGSDFFRVKANWLVVTEGVRDAFKKAKIINVRFTPLTEVEISTYIFSYSQD